MAQASLPSSGVQQGTAGMVWEQGSSPSKRPLLFTQRHIVTSHDFRFQ